MVAEARIRPKIGRSNALAGQQSSCLLHSHLGHESRGGELGARGKRTTVTAGEIWVRELSGGRKAVGFFNRGTSDATMSIALSAVGILGTPLIRDPWRRTDVTGVTTDLSASVPGGAGRARAEGTAE